MTDEILPRWVDGPAYNPAAIDHQGRRVAILRTGHLHRSRLAVGVLDGLRPVSFRELPVDLPGDSHEDPRLFLLGGVPHFGFVSVDHRAGTHRVAVARLGDDLSADEARFITLPNMNTRERNWVFLDGEALVCSYSLSGGRHRVRGAFEAETAYRCPWRHGEPRGGTNFVERGGLLYGFFHGTSYGPGPLDHCDRTYHMGGLAIERLPPHRVVLMTPDPIAGPPSAEVLWPSRLNPARRHAVVFPTALLREDDDWVVLAGHQDRDIRAFRISHAELSGRLRPVRSVSL